jgi:redox-sensitive bicupin YhaK (pirin superfamily)
MTPKFPKLKGRIDVRRAEQRFATRTDWLNSRHSFSFGPHYDPDNTGHGLLIVTNDDVVRPGTGFMTHPHRDMEIVTWVLDGELEHKDSEGHKGIIYPGLAQRMSAGTGIWHSEMNPNGTQPVHFVQMWVLPDADRIRPGYEQLDVGRELEKGGLIQVASGKGDQSAISIRQNGAALWVGRLKPGERAAIPEAPFVHLYVAKGAVELEGAGSLRTGDAARLTAAGTPVMTADARTGAEVLVWESDQRRETG